MPKYTYAVLGVAKPGQTDEHRGWYAERHIIDVCAQPGVTSARLLAASSTMAVGLEAPEYSTLVLYELEADDVQTVLANIRSKAGTDTMPLTDAAERAGSIHLILNEIATCG